MSHRTGFHAFKLWLVVVVTSVGCCLILLSFLITAVGKGSPLDNKSGRTGQANINYHESSFADDPNMVTSGGYRLLSVSWNGMVAAAASTYSASRSLSSGTIAAGGGLVHSSSVAVRTTGSAVLASAKFCGSIWLYEFRVPGKVASSMVNTKAVAAVIRPAEATTAVPTIHTIPPEELLAMYKAKNTEAENQEQSQQLTANQQLGGSVIAGDPSHGGYPAQWDAPVRQDSLVDNWGMFNRECVSYAAWKVYQTYGDMPYWGGVGNANQWVSDAQASGIPTGNQPRVHSVAISMRGYYGHAVWVEAVKGNMIYVSQYNYNLDGHYSEMWVSADSFTYIYFK